MKKYDFKLMKRHKGPKESRNLELSVLLGLGAVLLLLRFLVQYCTANANSVVRQKKEP